MKTITEAVELLLSEIEENLKIAIENGNNSLSLRGNTFHEIVKAHSDGDAFIWEILQNIEDATFDGVSETDVYIELTENTLTINYHGKPFDYNDIESIGRGKSSKRKDSNKIGEKGIGFKSYFTVTEDLIIETGKFQLRFHNKCLRETLEGRPGMKSSLARHDKLEVINEELQHLWRGVPTLTDTISKENPNEIKITFKVNNEKHNKIKKLLDLIQEDSLVFFERISSINVTINGIALDPLKKNDSKYNKPVEKKIGLQLDESVLFNFCQEESRLKYKDGNGILKILIPKKINRSFEAPFFRVYQIRDFNFKLPYQISANFLLNKNRSNLDYSESATDSLGSYWNRALLKTIAKEVIDEICTSRSIEALFCLTENKTEKKDGAHNHFLEQLKSTFKNNTERAIFPSFTSNKTLLINIEEGIIDETGVINLFKQERIKSDSPIHQRSASKIKAIRDFFEQRPTNPMSIRWDTIKNFINDNDELTASEQIGIIHFLETQNKKALETILPKIESLFITRVNIVTNSKVYLQVPVSLTGTIIKDLKSINVFYFRPGISKDNQKKFLRFYGPEIYSINSLKEAAQTDNIIGQSFVRLLNDTELAELPALDFELYDRITKLKDTKILVNAIDLTIQEKKFFEDFVDKKEINSSLYKYLSIKSQFIVFENALQLLVKSGELEACIAKNNFTLNDLILRYFDFHKSSTLQLPRNTLQIKLENGKRFDPRTDWFLNKNKTTDKIKFIWDSTFPNQKLILMKEEFPNINFFKQLNYESTNEESIVTLTINKLIESLKSTDRKTHIGLADKACNLLLTSNSKLSSGVYKEIEDNIKNQEYFCNKDILCPIELTFNKDINLSICNLFTLHDGYGKDVHKLLSGFQSSSITSFLGFHRDGISNYGGIKDEFLLSINGKWNEFWAALDSDISKYLSELLRNKLDDIECIPSLKMKKYKTPFDLDDERFDFEGIYIPICQVFKHLADDNILHVKKMLLQADVDIREFKKILSEVPRLQSSDIDELMKERLNINIVSIENKVIKLGDAWLLDVSKKTKKNNYDQDLTISKRSKKNIIDVSVYTHSNWQIIFGSFPERLIDLDKLIVNCENNRELKEFKDSVRIYLFDQGIEIFLHNKAITLELDNQFITWFKHPTMKTLDILIRQELTSKPAGVRKDIRRIVSEILPQIPKDELHSFLEEHYPDIESIENDSTKGTKTKTTHPLPTKTKPTQISPLTHPNGINKGKQEEEAILDKKFQLDVYRISNDMDRMMSEIENKQIFEKNLVICRQHKTELAGILSSMPADSVGVLYISSGWAKSTREKQYGFEKELSTLHNFLLSHENIKLKLFFEYQDFKGIIRSNNAQETVNQILKGSTASSRISISNHPQLHSKVIAYISKTHPENEVLIIGSHNWLSNSGENSIELSYKNTSDKNSLYNVAKFFDLIEDDFRQIRSGIVIPE